MPSEDGEDEDGYFRSVGAYSIFISTFYGFNIRQDVFLLRYRVTRYEIETPLGVVWAVYYRKEIRKVPCAPN